MIRIMFLIIGIPILFFISVFTYADEIILNSGDVFIGEIVAENEYEVRIKTSFGEIPIAKKNIKSKKIGMTEKKGEQAQLIMRDGSIIEGSIIDTSTNSIKFKSGIGIMDINRKDVARIVYMDEKAFNAANNGNNNYNASLNNNSEIEARRMQYRNDKIVLENVSDPEIDDDRWYIRQGSNLLTEEEFLSKTGHHDEKMSLNNARENRMIFHYMFITLAGISLGGAYAFAAFDITSSSNDDDSDLYWSVSCLGAAIGFGLIGYGIFPLKEHYLSYSKAKKYTEAHNIKLRQQLSLTKNEIISSSSIKENLKDAEKRKRKNIGSQTKIVIPVSFRF